MASRRISSRHSRSSVAVTQASREPRNDASGANGGTANLSPTGGSTPFSTATETAAITVNAVNDAPALDNSGNADCENGQRGYPMGRLARLLKPTDSKGAPFLVVGDSHTPGNQGPTFAGLSRVPPGETFSREPQNGAQLP